MVQQDKVFYDDRENLVRSNPVGQIASNCALGAIGALLVRLWLPGIELMTVVIELFVIVLSVLAVVFGIRGLLLARKRSLVTGGAMTGLGIGLATLILIPIAAHFIGPAQRRARQSEECIENLTLMFGAAKQYAQRHPGQTVAPTLRQLAMMNASNGFNAKRLSCPVDPDRPARNTSGQYCSYAWIPNQKLGDPTHVLAYCDCNVHGDGTNVLMADGKVQFLTRKELDETLAKTRSDIEAAEQTWAPIPRTPSP